MMKTVAGRFVSFSKEDDAVSAKDAMDGKVTMDSFSFLLLFCYWSKVL